MQVSAESGAQLVDVSSIELAVSAGVPDGVAVTATIAPPAGTRDAALAANARPEAC